MPIVNPTPPTTPPALPQRADRSTFSSRVDAGFTWFQTAVTEVYGLAQNAVNNATEALGSASAAATSASTATTQANLATAQAAAAAALTNALPHNPATNYTLGQAALSNINLLAYRRKSAGSSVADPSTDSTNWSPALPAAGIQKSSRTSNIILGISDTGNYIEITSGTFSQTFSASATLGVGWYCYYKNAGTGDITISLNGAETIDGVASFVIYPQETRLIICDGTNFNSFVITPFIKKFTTTGTFIPPKGYAKFDGILWGAGGSGGAGTGALYCTGGGGGAGIPFSLSASTITTSQSVVIGAGGAAITSGSPIAGNAGGNSTFAGLTAYGGGAGFSTASNVQVCGGGGGGAYSAGGNGINAASVVGGSPTASTYTNPFGGGTAIHATGTSVDSHSIYGGGAGGSTTTGGFAASAGGRSLWGGGGGGASTNTGSNAGGTSFYGGAGGAAIALGGSSGNGTDGSIPAGGGGGAKSGTSGAGARGELLIWGV